MEPDSLPADAASTGAEAVQAHTPSLVVWDVPSAIVAGERFRVKVGVKCASECRLADGRLAIYDHQGAHVATATLPGDVWPGTTALYAAEIGLQAPAEEGLHTWSVRGPDLEGGVPHAEGSGSFGVRVVAQPEHLITIEVVDRASQTPLPGVRVVMHPYRTETDERGVAQVRVAKGTYTLFVSQTRYITVGLPVEVGADMRTRAELDLAPVPERN